MKATKQNPKKRTHTTKRTAKTKQKKLKLTTRLNQLGVYDQLIVVIAFIVIFGSIGTYFFLGAHAATPSTTKPTPVHVPTTWLLARTAFAGVNGSSQVATGLASGTTYQISNPSSTDTAITSKAVISYHTYGGTATVNLIKDKGALPAGTKAIILDQENWNGSCISSPADPCTPASDLSNPVSYATQASQAVKSAGLTFIDAPAIDLFGGKGTLPCTTQYYQCYLNYNMAGKMAAISNVLEIQAQSLGNTPSTYTSFVDQAVAQAKAANPKIVILAGLSTTDSTASQMETDVSDTDSVVSGYWMNIPDNNFTAAEQVMVASGL